MRASTDGGGICRSAKIEVPHSVRGESVEYGQSVGPLLFLELLTPVVVWS